MNCKILLLILLFAVPASAAGIIQSTAECDLWSRVLAGKLLAACGDNTVLLNTFTSSGSIDVDLDSGPYAADLRAEGNVRKYKTMVGFSWRREGNQEADTVGVGYFGENVAGGVGTGGTGDPRLDVNNGSSDLPFSVVLCNYYPSETEITNSGATMGKHELTTPNHGWLFPIQHASADITRTTLHGSNEADLTQSCVLHGTWTQAGAGGFGTLGLTSTVAVQIAVYNGANAWTVYHNGEAVASFTNAITPNVNIIGSVCPSRFSLRCTDSTADTEKRTRWYFAAVVKRAMTKKECKEMYLNMRGFYAL